MSSIFSSSMSNSANQDLMNALASAEAIRPGANSFPPNNRTWLKSLAQLPSPGQPMSIFVAILGLCAFGMATYLTVPWFFEESKIVGCNGSVFNCDHVMNSRYSNWLGLPVSGIAAVTYFCMLGALVMAQRGSQVKRNYLWAFITFCCLSAGAAALWFIFLQSFVLKHWCQYCLIAHGCGIVLAITLLLTRPLGAQTNTYMGILALAGLAVLSVGQAVGKEAQTFHMEEHVIVAPQKSSENSDTGNDSSEDPNFLEAPVMDDIFEAPDQSSHKPAPDFNSLKNSAYMIANFIVPSAVHSSAMMLVQDDRPEPEVDNQNQESGSAEGASQQDETPNEQTDTPPTPPQTRRILEVAGGKIKLDVKQWPMAGKTDAEFVCVEMFDYNCQHCRETHAAVRAAKQRLGDRFAVITLPLPLNTNCNNQISQTGAQFMESCNQAAVAIAVWKLNPEKFSDFHDWMFEGPRAPTFQEAKTRAESVVGKEELQKMLESPLPKAFIDKHVQMYARLNRGNIPKLLFNTTSIVGLFQAPDQLVEILNRQGPLKEVPITN